MGDDRTTNPVRKRTRRRVKQEKARRGARSYDALIAVMFVLYMRGSQWVVPAGGPYGLSKIDRSRVAQVTKPRPAKYFLNVEASMAKVPSTSGRLMRRQKDSS